MENSMDMIKVSYGVLLTEEEQYLLEHSFIDEERAKELKSKIKTCSIREFIYPEDYPNNPKLNLSEREQKVQQALKLIYELNGKETPLYHKFSTFRQDTNPLIIDTTIVRERNNGDKEAKSAASYGPMDNKVVFEKVDDLNFLVLVLSHELKHAEQNDEAAYHQEERMMNASFFGIPIENAYAWHQLEFLSEAQAFETGARAYYEIFGHTDDTKMTGVKTYEEILKKHANDVSHRGDKKIEEEAISAILDRVYGSPYKDLYDMRAPIGENDPGLDCIPEVFHLPQSLMKKLQEAPRRARRFRGKLLQAKKNNHLDEYIRLLHDGVDEKMPKDYEEVLGYILENASPAQIHDILTLKRTDSQYVFNIEKVRDLFKGCGIQQIISPAALKYLVEATRDGEKIATSENIANILSFKTKIPEDFKKSVAILSDDEGRLPLIEKDLRASFDNTRNVFLGHFGPYDEDWIKMLPLLPQILKLTGRDGKVLVREEQFAKALDIWVRDISRGKNCKEEIKLLFDAIKDEKGNLPLSRKTFDTKEGKNILLESLIQAHSDYAEQLPILMSLKDKYGKPIISQENIDRFPENSPLTSSVKSHKKSGNNTGKSGLIQMLSKSADKRSLSNKKQPPLSILKGQNTPQAGG